MNTPVKTIMYRILAACFIVFLLFSCGHKSKSGGSDGQAAVPAAGDLVTWTYAGSLDVVSLYFALVELGITDVSITSSVPCYRLVYKTPDPEDTLVDASGLVCLPVKKSSGNPVLSYQHGTIFADTEAPSYFSSSPEGLIGAVLAGLGYIVVMPDYLGYGESANTMHPYLHAATLASSSVDMNRAARIFLATSGKNASMNGQLFLTGYSEGGYATMAAQRLMEQSLSAEFAITASESGAGPYDLSGTTKTALGLPAQGQPAFDAFMLKAYDSLYNASSQLDFYFLPPYADVVSTYFDGAYTRTQITAALGGSGVATNVLFNPAFLADYLGSGETQLKAHIAENDVYNWAPKTATRIFHGMEDDVVPYANATTARDTMTNNGSTTVTLVNCDAGIEATTHDNCAKPFAMDMIQYFKPLVSSF